MQNSARKESLALVGVLTAQNELTIKPEAGATAPILELEFTNNETEKCPATVLGDHKITGTAVAKVLKPETPEEAKEVESWVDKSSLKFSEESAALTGNLKLPYTGLGDKVYVSKEA
jgi:hypothetical protein